MTLTFWGVRGGIPVPGPLTVKTGGNTMCIDIADKESEHVVLDAGTGLIMLGKELLKGPCGKGLGEIHIYLTHTHWDHIQGFPYFVPAFIPGNKIHFWGRSVSERSLHAMLEGQMKAEYNPIFSLLNMGSSIDVTDIGRDPVHFGGFTMTTTILPHRGKASLGYRISDGDSTLVFMGDIEYEGRLYDALVTFAEGADLLIHDAGELKDINSGEHMAASLAKKAGVGRLILTHYGPEYTDDDVAAVVAAAKKAAGRSVSVNGAYEGLQLAL